MRLRVVVAMAAVTLLAGACTSVAASPPASSPSPAASLTDAMGRTVVFAAPPVRIAIAGKASFQVADAVYMFPEASSRVVALPKASQGADFISAIDPAYSAKTILDGNAGAEAVAATHPDVVLMKSSSADTLGKPLAEIGIKVVYVDLETPSQYDRDLTTLGKLFGDEARAATLRKFFANRVEAIRQALEPVSARPRVLLLYYSSKNGAAAFQVPPLGFIQTAQVLLAAGEPVWKDAQLGNGWTTVGLEQIAAWDPDQIYVVAYFDKVADVVGRMKSDSQWQALRAVKSNQLFGFPGDFYSWDQSDARWILGLTWLAVHVHPSLTEGQAGIDMIREVRAFYGALYGIDGPDFDSLIAPRLPEEIR